MYARDFFETAILNLANNQTISHPSKMYVALLYSNPGESGAYAEVNYQGYARQEISFSAPVSGTGSHYIQNSEMITFAESTETAQTATHIGIFDNANSNTGNMWLYGALDQTIAITPGVSPIFQIGSIKFTLSGKISSAYRVKILNTLRGEDGEDCAGFIPYFGCAIGDIDVSVNNEFSGTNYSRVQISFSTPDNLSSGAMAIHNTDTFATDYAGSNWGSWAYTVVFDNSTVGSGGAFYYSSRTPNNIYKGGACGYNAGDLVLTIN